MKIRLRFSTGSLRGQAPLRDITDGGSVTIGRADDNSIALDPGVDVAASSYHAQFYLTGGQLYLYDLNSTNGTFVNRQRITAVAVRPGDRIAFGHPGVGPECDLEVLPDSAPVTGATSPLHVAPSPLPATTSPMAAAAPTTTSPLMAGPGGHGMATHPPFNYSGGAAATSAMAATNQSTAPLMSAQAPPEHKTTPGTPALGGEHGHAPAPAAAPPATSKCQLCGSKLDDRSFVCYGCKMTLCWVHYDGENGMCRTCVALGRTGPSGGGAPEPARGGRLDLDDEPAADVPPGQVACAAPGCGFVGDPMYTFTCYGCQRMLCGHHYGDAGYCKDCASGGGPAPVAAAAAEPSVTGSGRFKTTRPMGAAKAGGPEDDLPPRRRRPSGDGDDLPPRRGRR